MTKPTCPCGKPLKPGHGRRTTGLCQRCATNATRQAPRYLGTLAALRDFIGKPCPGIADLAGHIGGGVTISQVRVDLDRLRETGLLTTQLRGKQRRQCIEGQWTDWSASLANYCPPPPFHQYTDPSERKIAVGSFQLFQAIDRALTAKPLRSVAA